MPELFHTPELKVYAALAHALEAEGADTIFGLMGDANMSLWSELLRRGKTTIHSARNEAGAVAMADGFHRASGRVGVATVTCGPGLTQTGTSLMAAARNGSALVVVTGEWPLDGPNQLQSMDQHRFAEACEAGYVQVTGGARMAAEMAGAFRQAQLRRGPVVLSVPNALQETIYPHPWRYSPSEERLPAANPPPAPDDVSWLAEALTQAKRPLLLAGRGAQRSGAREAIIALGDVTGALLGTTLQVRGLFSDQPWSAGLIGGYASQRTQDLCAEADLVVGIGARIGHYTSWGDTLFPHARIVRIDTAELPSREPLTPGRHLRGDATKTVMALLQALKNHKPADGFRTEATQARLSAANPAPPPEAQGGLDPRRTAAALARLLQGSARLTCGVGHFQGFVVNYMPVGPEIEVEYSSQFGAVGQTLPLALGVGMSDRDRRHLVIEGDGSLMMNIQELDLAARCGRSMTLAVWNDAGYGAEAHRLPGKGFDPGPATWTSPDFVTIAHGFGGDGVRVETAAELDAAIELARAAPGLFLLDLRVAAGEMSDTYAKNFYNKPNAAPFLP